MPGFGWTASIRVDSIKNGAIEGGGPVTLVPFGCTDRQRNATVEASPPVISSWKRRKKDYYPEEKVAGDTKAPYNSLEEENRIDSVPCVRQSRFKKRAGLLAAFGHR